MIKKSLTIVILIVIQAGLLSLYRKISLSSQVQHRFTAPAKVYKQGFPIDTEEKAYAYACTLAETNKALAKFEKKWLSDYKNLEPILYWTTVISKVDSQTLDPQLYPYKLDSDTFWIVKSANFGVIPYLRRQISFDNNGKVIDLTPRIK